MKGFVYRVLIFLLPVFGLLALYLYLDPFKVVGLYNNYKPMGSELSVPLNQNRVSAGTYLYHNDSVQYNSFIFGSSRSMFYEVADWKPYLGGDARCFHFDASAETLQGILHKIRFLDQRGADFHNVLLILDADIFRTYELLNEHLYMEDPLVVGYRNWLPFHAGHFMAFMNRKFMRAYLDYRITGKSKAYMTDLNVLDDKPFVYDPNTNELRYAYFEHLAADGSYYDYERMRKFGKERDGVERFSSPVISAEHQEVLREIATILQAKECDIRVVISPLYDQVRFADADLNVLKEILGPRSVFDFSGINTLTASHTGYYERSHYRPHIAKAVLDSIYKQQSR